MCVFASAAAQLESITKAPAFTLKLLVTGASVLLDRFEVDCVNGIGATGKASIGTAAVFVAGMGCASASLDEACDELISGRGGDVGSNEGVAHEGERAEGADNTATVTD